jgi:hypothetical protein
VRVLPVPELSGTACQPDVSLGSDKAECHFLGILRVKPDDDWAEGCGIVADEPFQGAYSCLEFGHMVISLSVLNRRPFPNDFNCMGIAVTITRRDSDEGAPSASVAEGAPSASVAEGAPSASVAGEGAKGSVHV